MCSGYHDAVGTDCPACLCGDNFNIDFGGGAPSDGFAGAGGQSDFWNSPGIPAAGGDLLNDLSGVETTVTITSTNFQAVGGTSGMQPDIDLL